MQTLLLWSLCTMLTQNSPATFDPSEETIAKTKVYLGILQQCDRIPPEFSEEARDKLARMGVDALPLVLIGMKEQSANTISLLRSAGDEIVQAAVRDSVTLPVSYLEKFAAHERQQPDARRAAIQWAGLQVPRIRDRFLEEHLNHDVFRDDAIQAAIVNGRAQRHAGQHDEAVRILTQAFDSVQSPDQAFSIAAELKQLTVVVPLRSHLGALSHWRVIGPFPWSINDAFSKEWPPESRKDAEEACAVKSQRLAWSDAALEPDGVVQTFNGLAPVEENSIVYAFTTIALNTARNLELRAGAVGRLEVRINDETIVHGDTDWTSLTMDHVRKPVKLRAGENRILVKLGAMSRNTAPDAPLPTARFVLRFVNESGAGVDLEDNR